MLRVAALASLLLASNSVPTNSISWKRVPFEPGHLALAMADVGDEAAPEVKAWPQGGVIMQTVSLGDDHQPLRLLIRAAPDETLEGFRRDHSMAKFSKLESIRICGKPAKRLIASEAEQHITCVMVPADDPRGNHPAFVPAMTTVAVSFQHRGQTVVASWSIETALRDVHHADEAHFFDTIECL
jgi:hypothetical protein